MSNPKCKTCVYYMQYPIVKNEGECDDPTKIVFVSGEQQNDRPSVFDFSWCENHRSEDTVSTGD